MEKHIRSANARGSARLAKKPCHSLMTDHRVTISLTSFRGCRSGHGVSEPIFATQEAAPEVAPTASEPTIIIMTSESTRTIPSPTIMIQG